MALTRLAGARHPLPHVGEGQRHPRPERGVIPCRAVLCGRPTLGMDPPMGREPSDRADKVSAGLHLAHAPGPAFFRVRLPRAPKRGPQAAPPDPLSLMWEQVDESRNSCRGCGNSTSPRVHMEVSLLPLVGEGPGGKGLFRAGVLIPCRGVPTVFLWTLSQIMEEGGEPQRAG